MSGRREGAEAPDGRVVHVRSHRLIEGPDGAPAGVAVADEGQAVLVVPRMYRERLGLPALDLGEDEDEEQETRS